MVFAVINLRRVLEFCLAITLSVLVLISCIPRATDNEIAHNLDELHVDVPVQNLAVGIVQQVAIPFGQPHQNPSPGPSHLPEKGPNQIAVRADPNTPSLEQAVANGNKLLGIIAAAQSKPSIWTQADFDVGGWEDNSKIPQTIPDTLRTVMQELKIPTGASDIQKTSAEQFKTGFENMNCEIVEDDQSGGQYLVTYVPAGATMIMNSVISPMQNIYNYYAGMEMPRPSAQELRKMIPRMNRWSDIVWFLWAKKAGNRAGDLRYLFRDNVVNKGTRTIMDQVFKVPVNTLDLPWPGKTFEVGTSMEGKALLGSPLGTGIAWLLADHKETLGERSIKVTCFTSDSFLKDKIENKYYMLFELVPI